MAFAVEPHESPRALPNQLVQVDWDYVIASEELLDHALSISIGNSRAEECDLGEGEDGHEDLRLAILRLIDNLVCVRS